MLAVVAAVPAAPALANGRFLALAALVSWLAMGLLAPAIGLGVSTVTIWTPYPSRSSRSEHDPPPGQVARWLGAPPARSRPGSPGAEALSNALADEAMTSRLVDELLVSMLARTTTLPGDRRTRLAPVIPVVHGVSAVVTFLFVMLAAIAGC